MPRTVHIPQQPSLGTSGWSKSSSSLLAPDLAPSLGIPLEIEEMPRWAELVTRALSYLPPAIIQESPAIMRGILQLLHEHTPTAWALTITEGNPFQFPETCREVRYHCYQKGSGEWGWNPKSTRANTAATTLRMLLEPATVADHAKLLRMPAQNKGPIAVYRWGGQGFIAILNIAGITMGIRDMPGLPEANDILVTREGVSGHAFDQLEMDTIVKLFSRAEDQPMQADREDILIDDATDGLSGVPSAFMSLARSSIRDGVLEQVNRMVRMAGPGKEVTAWQRLSATDQHRFNSERVRHLLIPHILEPCPSNAPGAEAADVLLLLGLVGRFSEAEKPRDDLANRSLPEFAIQEAARHLKVCRDHHASHDAVDKRLALLAQVWAYYCGNVPAWAPEGCYEKLEKELNAFMARLSRRTAMAASGC